MTTTIRKASLKDVEKLSSLFDKYRIFYGKTSDIKQAEEFLSQRIKNKESEIFIAINQDDEMVGFVQLYPLFSSTRMKRLWLLNDLFVEEFHRGKGISVELISRAKELCKTTNACGLSLETEKTNHIGNQLYPKTGFNLDSEHNYYFWDNL